MGGIGGESERDIRLSFDRVAETYERARPTYPAELFDALFTTLPAQPSIVEVGPGTGQATGDLLARGARVTAVEIGPNLAAVLAAKFKDVEALSVRNDSFEQVALEPNSFDAVVGATMYHWIAPGAQISRPLELLRPGGLLGVIDLIQVDAVSDQGYFRQVQPIYESFGQAQSDWDPKTHETAQPAIAGRLRESERYEAVEVHRVPWDQTYSSAQYGDLLHSYSGTQMMPSRDRDAMVDQLVTVIDEQYGGVVTRPLVATLTIARSVVEAH